MDACRIISREQRGLRLVGALALAALALAGCESSRFGSNGRGRVAPGTEPTVSSVPSGSITAEPLAPPPGSGPGPVATLPGGPGPIETLGSGGGYAPAPVAVTRSTAIGAWTARDATGASCRVNLSSTSSLDLYRASASGCANRDLARVTAWDFRDGEVFLYQPGGSVAARLRPSGGDLSGVLSKSGAPLTLTRG